MSNSIDSIFARSGEPLHAPSQGLQCPSDEAFAGYLDPVLPAREREALEVHALSCVGCHDLLRMLVDLHAESRPAGATAAALAEREPRPAAFRIVGRLMQSGIELLNHADLAFRTLVDGPLPALGAVRGSGADAPAASEWVSIRGPGSGLDELELQRQANGTARLTVRCHRMPPLASSEVASILLDVDGAAREKRPFAGEAIDFAPIGRGSYRVRLVARAPGGPARPLAEATLELSG